MAVMGIVNVTPDSFSDGGQFFDPSVAIGHAREMAEAGAEIVDIGGESTRPGSEGVSAEVELERVMPVIRGFRRHHPQVPVSIDTSKVEVARAALDAGAGVINDVTAGASPGMFELAAERGVGLVLMHMRGRPRIMQKDTHYDDVVEEVRAYLIDRAEAAIRAGVGREAIVLDPGIGFGKSVEGNLDLIRGLGRLADAGFPVMLGTSRKAFTGKITGAPIGERTSATLATLVPALELDRVIVRVHDVVDVIRFRTMIEAIRRPATSD